MFWNTSYSYTVIWKPVELEKLWSNMFSWQVAEIICISSTENCLSHSRLIVMFHRSTHVDSKTKGLYFLLYMSYYL